jgi:hypothetical protein
MTKSLASQIFLTCMISGSVSLCIGFGMSGVQAGDWSLEARTTSKVDLNDNYYLKPVSDGFVFGSFSNVNVDLIHKSAIDRFDLIGDLGYQTYFGAVQSNSQNKLLPKLSARYHLSGKTDSIDLGAGYFFSDINSIDPLDPIGLGINRNLTQNTFFANAAYGKTLSPRLTVGSAASFQDVFFSDTGIGINPYTSTNLSTYVKYRLTKTTDVKATLGGQWQSIDDLQNSLNSSYYLRGDISSQLEKNLSVSVGAGPRIGIDYFDNVFAPLTPRISSNSIGWIADANVKYDFKSGSISASASHSIDPDVLGNLQSRDTFSLAATQAINEESQFDVSAQYRVSTNLTPIDQKTFIFAPVYRYRLAREWSMAAGYTFTWTDGGAGSGRSDDLFLSLSRSFVLIP